MCCIHIAEIASPSYELFLLLSSSTKYQEAKRLRGVEKHRGNKLAPATCLLSCLIHLLYHLIIRMWRCGREALSSWDRKGGAILHLLLPWPSSTTCLLATRVANNIAQRGRIKLPYEHTSAADTYNKQFYHHQVTDLRNNKEATWKCGIQILHQFSVIKCEIIASKCLISIFNIINIPILTYSVYILFPWDLI